MKISHLFSLFLSPAVSTDLMQLEVVGVTAEAKKVQLGFAFVAIRGTKFDGHAFIGEAIERGCVALVVEDKERVPAGFSGFVLQVPNTRLALDILASRFYEEPSHELFCFGVTGTNGKTSITFLIEHILGQMNIRTGVMGTIHHRVGEKIWPTQMTTPGPLELQQRLREFVDAGAKAVAMEITSHALDQKRADSVSFNTVIFSNLTRDHLDYHKTMKAYFAAKQRLFTDLIRKSYKYPIYAIINTQDSYGRKLKVADPAVLWTYGARDSDFRHKILKSDFSGTHFQLQSQFGEQKIFIPQPGEHNVLNTIAAMIAALSAGVPLARSAQALAEFKGVPGRLQRLPTKGDVHVFVDYAHTPDALENVLVTLNKVRKSNKTKNRIFTVFGCGGDRDPGKRPQMAKIAERLSDFSIVTSDNPRTEDPQKIVNDIVKGFTKSKSHEVILDRREAITKGVSMLKKGDVLLIAGKGHEDYQIIGEQRFPFSDFEVAKEVLSL